MKRILQEHWLTAAALAVGAAVAVFFSLPPSSPKEQGKRTPISVEPPILAIKLPVSSPVRVFVDSAAKTDWSSAITALAHLPPSLSSTEQRVLIDFLESGMPELDHLTPARNHHVANDLMKAILRQQQISRRFVPALIRIAQSRTLDPVIRDYSLQALGLWLSVPRNAATSPEFVQPTIAALLAAAADIGAPTSGTALIALEFAQRHNISSDSERKTIGVRQGEFLAVLDNVISNPEANPSTRASALQIATRLNRPHSIRYAREIAANPTAPANLRASALAVIGELGSAAVDSRILNECLGNSHLLISLASKAATEKLAKQL